MSKTLLVLKNEFISTVKRKSFILTLVLLPLVGMLSLLVINIIQKTTGQSAGSIIGNLVAPSVVHSLEGYVDESGLVKTIPPGYEYRLKSFDSEASAKTALANKEITAYYIISKEYLTTGDVIYIRPDFNPFGATQSNSLYALMAYALTDGNLDLAYRMQNPVNVRQVSVSNVEQRDSNNPLTFIIPYVVTFLFYIVILTSSSLMLSSITNEKQNRVMEILMTSVTPTEMLTGKIIALGLAGLIQTLVWLGSGMLMLNLSGQVFSLTAAFQLPVSLLLWGVLFFVFGYAVYASLMAGVGALVPNMREASQATTVIIMPMVVPLVFINQLIQQPNSTLTVILSIFPLTAPSTMMARIANIPVPLWQILLSLGLLILTAIFLIRGIAGLFRTQNMLSGSPFSLKRFFRLLLNPA